mgnify:CR=1 FL=1
MSNHPLTPEHDPDPQRKTVLNLYAALAVSIILTFMPNTIMAIVSLVFVIGVLVASYSIRKKAEPESLAENHATYIIRTIWIASFISVITLGIGAVILLNDIDYSAFGGCPIDLEFAASADYMQLWEVMQPCYDTFITDNWNILIISGAITILPILLYLVIRFVKGLSRAIKGYRIANPKAWF